MYSLAAIFPFSFSSVQDDDKTSTFVWKKDTKADDVVSVEQPTQTIEARFDPMRQQSMPASKHGEAIPCK